MTIRVLFLADSHLGLDLPLHPRVPRRRRGHDFVANHTAALHRALCGDVDLVVHGGDVFDRPGAPPGLARVAYEPLLRVADAGIPVFVLAGNHERSILPHAHLLRHPRIHVFERPRTVALEVRGVELAISGFPYERHHVRRSFRAVLEQTGWRHASARVRLLCMHHCVEGATVGPADFTFTTAPDVVRGRDLPDGFTAVLSGHIHRHQVLTANLDGNALPVPVLYPGSIERTSTAEIGEAKGYLLLDIAPSGALTWRFMELPARPMLVSTIAAGADAAALEAHVHRAIRAAPSAAVLQIRIRGQLSDAQLRVISAARIRRFAPATMNVEIRPEELLLVQRSRTPGPAAGTAGPAIASEQNLQLEL